MTGHPDLWLPAEQVYTREPAPPPDSARWVHVSHVDPEEAALLDLYGETVPRTTVTFHHPRTCCDRDQYH